MIKEVHFQKILFELMKLYHRAKFVTISLLAQAYKVFNYFHLRFAPPTSQERSCGATDSSTSAWRMTKLSTSTQCPTLPSTLSFQTELPGQREKQKQPLTTVGLDFVTILNKIAKLSFKFLICTKVPDFFNLNHLSWSVKSGH